MKENRKIIFFIIVYRLLLDLVYAKIISPNYFYSGFVDNSSVESTFISLMQVVIYIPFFIKCFSKDGFTNYVVLLLGILYFIPGTSLMRFIPMSAKMLFAWNVFWLFLLFLGTQNYVLKVPQFILNNCRIFGYMLVVIFCMTVLYVSYKYTGFRFLITFTDEYSLRAEQRSYEVGKLLSYIYTMSSTVISLMICMFSVKKNYIMAVLLFLVQIFNFSIGGHKTYLLFAVLAMMLGCLYEKFYKVFKDIILLYGVIGVLLMECIEKLLFGTFYLSANISRRVLFVPQILNYYYYDFFTKNEFDYFRQGPLRLLGFSSRYEKGISLIIGEKYIGENCNACNGLFSEAYSNMGIIGVVILPIILLVVLLTIEYLLKGMERSTLVFFAFLCAYIFGSGNISTGLVSNGIIAGIIVCMFLKRGTANERGK